MPRKNSTKKGKLKMKLLYIMPQKVNFTSSNWAFAHTHWSRCVGKGDSTKVLLWLHFLDQLVIFERLFPREYLISWSVIILRERGCAHHHWSVLNRIRRVDNRLLNNLHLHFGRSWTIGSRPILIDY